MEILCTAWNRVEMGACGFHLHPWHAWNLVGHSHKNGSNFLPWNQLFPSASSVIMAASLPSITVPLLSVWQVEVLLMFCNNWSYRVTKSDDIHQMWTSVLIIVILFTGAYVSSLSSIHKYFKRIWFIAFLKCHYTAEGLNMISIIWEICNFWLLNHHIVLIDCFFDCFEELQHWDRYTRVTADRENWNRGERRC